MLSIMPLMGWCYPFGTLRITYPIAILRTIHFIYCYAVWWHRVFEIRNYTFTPEKTLVLYAYTVCTKTAKCFTNTMTEVMRCRLGHVFMCLCAWKLEQFVYGFAWEQFCNRKIAPKAVNKLFDSLWDVLEDDWLWVPALRRRDLG